VRNKIVMKIFCFGSPSLRGEQKGGVLPRTRSMRFDWYYRARGVDDQLLHDLF